jgi:hypothetical protein
VDDAVSSKASAYSFSSTDPGAGFSLESGKLHFVYEGTDGSDD